MGPANLSCRSCGVALRVSAASTNRGAAPGSACSGHQSRTRNRRVVDASVFPIIPDCRIQNTVYMVGEKGADAIKADHADLYK
ncbi:hypothetical protein [Mycobacterium avium]|uniref:hypothetical protein n=1 Tax=Mycobacterium avium TaxID=1764 RepID=UPI00355AE5FE